MNYLDELLTIYDGQPDPLVRKYLLSAMGLRPLTFASQDLVELLWGQVSASDPRVRHAARRELGRVLPRHLKRDYGLDLGNASVWTGYYRPRTPGALHDRWQPAWDDKARPAIDAGYQRLFPVALKALELAHSGSHVVRQVASMAVGRIPLRPIAAKLAERLASGNGSFHDAAALSEMGTPDAHDTMLAAARKYALSGSDLIALLSTIPPELTLPVLEAMESRTDAYGRTNIALALGQDRSPRGRELLARLARRKEGWATAHVLDVLQSEPMADDLPLIKSIFEQESHDFLRVLAVRTAGYALASPTVAFVKSLAQDPSQRVRAAALEALARMRVAPESLAQVAGPLCEAPLLKARVTALLVLSHTDADRVAAAAEGLLFSGEPIQRLEGAYLLGYLSGPESAGALTEMALHDADPDVRCQSVKSLTRQPDRIALERLLGLLAAPDPKVARLAARALALLELPSLPVAIAGLDRASRAATSSLKTSFLRAAGMAAARLPASAVPSMIADHLASTDAAEVWGAVEALKFQLGGATAAQLEPHFKHPDPRVRASAALAAFWSGSDTAPSVILDLLSASQEETVLAGLNALLECAALLPVVVASGRCKALAAAPAPADAPALAEVQLDPLSQQGGASVDEEWVSVNAPASLRTMAVKLKDSYRSGPGAAAQAARSALSAPAGAAGPASPAAASRANAVPSAPPQSHPSAQLPGAPPSTPPVDNTSAVGASTPLARRPRKQTADAPDAPLERSVIGEPPAPRKRKTVKEAMLDLNALGEPVTPARSRGPIIAGALLTTALLAASIYLTRSRTPEVVAGPVHTFEVDYVKNDAFRAGIESPVALALGKHVATGDVLSTAADSQLSAKAPEGASLWLDPKSKLTLGPSATAPRGDVWFSDPHGVVTLDLRRVGSSAVWAPPCLIRGKEALIKLTDDGQARTLTIQAGKVEVDIPGEGSKLLTDGMKEVIPRDR